MRTIATLLDEPEIEADPPEIRLIGAASLAALMAAAREKLGRQRVFLHRPSAAPAKPEESR